MTNTARLHYQKQNGRVRVVEVVDGDLDVDPQVVVEIVPTPEPLAPKAIVPTLDAAGPRQREQVDAETIGDNVADAVATIVKRRQWTPSVTVVDGTVYKECEVPKEVAAELNKHDHVIEYHCCGQRQRYTTKGLAIERDELDFMPLYKTVVVAAVAICHECLEEVRVQLCG